MIKERKNIIVVDSISTGLNFISDIVNRGYYPIVLETKTDSSDIINLRKSSYAQIQCEFDVIPEKDTYEETLSSVREFDPVIIVPGSESGVVIATKLAEDLGLIGNPTKRLPYMTQKSYMHEALKQAGIRYINGRVISTVKEALDFLRENKIQRSVVKPIESAGSQGLYFCDNESDVENAIKEILGTSDIFGHYMEKVIIQERIEGTEYVVNTVSCEGKHRLTSFMRYSKKRTKEGGNIYDYCESVNRLEPGYSELIEYAFEVADAVGVEYGPIHGEYIIDDKGPVLVEVNCRPVGCSMPAKFLDLSYGQHETDTILDAYIDKEKFFLNYKKPYHPMRKSILKFIMVPSDMESEALPIWTIASKLRSTFSILASEEDAVAFFKKTRDLESNGGIVYMVHDDERTVMNELDFLKTLESEFFNLLINDGMSRPWFVKEGHESDVNHIIETADCQGSILILTDRDISVPKGVLKCMSELSDVDESFENIIVDLNESIVGTKENELIDMLFDIFSRVQVGGRVIIPESCYYYLSYKRSGAEALLKAFGYYIEAPFPNQKNLVIGKRDQ